MYGKGKRVHNFASSLYGGTGGWRCIVCIATKALGAKQRKGDFQCG